MRFFCLGGEIYVLGLLVSRGVFSLIWVVESFICLFSLARFGWGKRWRVDRRLLDFFLSVWGVFRFVFGLGLFFLSLG